MDENCQQNEIVNRGISEMLIAWVNYFEFDQKISSLEELADGELLCKIGKLILYSMKKENDHEIQAEIVENQLNGLKRYEFIEFMVKKCLIVQGINYEAALKGQEYQLAKILTVLLMNGIALEQKQVLLASDRLDNEHYNTIQLFYNVIDTSKCKFPGDSIQFYEQFLTCPLLSPKAKTSQIAIKLSSTKKRRTLSFQAQYFESPISSIAKQNIVHNLEQELQSKMMSISELEEQLKEKDELRIIQEIKLNEMLRKLTELNIFKEKAYKYDILCEKEKSFEREKLYYEQKCKIFVEKCDELEQLRETYDEQRKKFIQLENDYNRMEKKEYELNTELRRSKRIEKQLLVTTDLNQEQARTIANLIKERDEVVSELSQLKLSYEDQFSKLSHENAFNISNLQMSEQKLAQAKEDADATNEEYQSTIKEVFYYYFKLNF
jgi:hypothetical protein